PPPGGGRQRRSSGDDPQDAPPEDGHHAGQEADHFAHASKDRTHLTTLGRVFFASITDPLVQFAVDVIDKLGLVGVFVLMVAESACLPIPSEGTMLFAGFNVAEGEWSLFAVTAVGVAANLVGSWIAYGIGYFGRVDLLEKHGAKLHIKPSHLKWADNWFERY